MREQARCRSGRREQFAGENIQHKVALQGERHGHIVQTSPAFGPRQLVISRGCHELQNINAALLAGFDHTSSTERTLPANRRYLPPPSSGESFLAQRMRRETVMVFVRQ